MNMSFFELLDEEWLFDHKQSIGVDALSIIALVAVLLSEHYNYFNQQPQTITTTCRIDPYL